MTLHLSALMANSGTIYAFDVVAKRMAQLSPRLARTGASNIRPIVIAPGRDQHVRRLTEKIDRVLVDVPGTGLGTLRRNPDIKWRPLRLESLTAEQRQILSGAARLVRPAAGWSTRPAACSRTSAKPWSRRFSRSARTSRGSPCSTFSSGAT